MNQNSFGDDPTLPEAGLPAGTLLNHYKIISKIGSGGMGDVYLAEDSSLNRKVAVKLLSARLSSSGDFRIRFEREARAAASLSHPNIVTVHEVGEFRGRPFFSMEMVEGRSLKDLLREGPLPIEQIVDIAMQICDGLDEAHRTGLIHRDIKPGNIILDKRGRVRILDFGLVKGQDAERLSQTGALTGTIHYMSPEQIQGAAVTSATDLFSLGVTLYELVSGRLPFSGNYEASVLYTIVNESPPSLRDARSDIPERLESVINKLLQKTPQQRYSTAAEAKSDLSELVSGVSTSTQPVASIVAQLPGRKLLMISATTLVVIVAALIGWQSLGPPTDDAVLGTGVLAVLPFDNLGNAEDDYLADGIMEAIRIELVMGSDLTVISRTSALQYRGSQAGARQIGEELSADYIVEGTIMYDRAPEPDRIRINVSLVKASSETNLWAEIYERDLGGIFELQSDIAQKVSAALDVKLSVIAGYYSTNNLEAYDYYLRGNQHFNATWNREDIEIAIQMYQRAVEIDSNFAAAWAMLGRGHESLYFERFDLNEERKQFAKQAIDRALALAPDAFESHLALGYYYYHCSLDYESALTEFALALEVQPNQADGGCATPAGSIGLGRFLFRPRPAIGSSIAHESVRCRPDIRYDAKFPDGRSVS
jgi:TolB-like protein